MATILGLLLVVTVIANYLSTTLPAQMSVNDLNHEVVVEDQLGHLQALLTSLTKGGAPGSPALQPITLGSDGAPPFAGPDGATVSSIPQQGPATVNFGVISTRYAPPTGWLPDTGTPPGCSGSYPNYSCPGGATVSANFSNSASSSTYFSFNFKATGGASLRLNYSVNSSTVVVTATGRGGGFEDIQLVGDANNMSISATGGAYQNLTIVGNNNAVTLAATSGTTVNIVMIGNNDQVTVTNTAGSANNVIVTGWGSYDSFTPGSGGTYQVYYTGFDPLNPTTPLCPYGNLSSTDSVTGADKQVKGATVYYNNTVYNNTQGSLANGWKYIYNTPPQYACIYFPQYNGGGATVFSAGLLVSLRNTYAPSAEVAFDQGAVVYAQSGGYPIMIDPPAISYAFGAATVVIPSFLNTVGTESGLGTAAAVLHLVSTYRSTFPGNGWYLNPSQSLKIVFQTPYAYAWIHYFQGIAAFYGHVSCSAPTGSAACTGPYQPGQSLGTVTFRLPASSLTIDLAVYSISLH